MTTDAGAGGRKRSVRIAGHRTSVSLEPEFWDALRDIARQDGIALAGLIAAVDAGRTTNLSSALRVYVLKRVQQAAEAPPTATSPAPPG